MNKTIRCLLIALSFLCVAEFSGCASTIDEDQENNTDGKKDTTTDNENDTTDIDGRDVCTGDECKEEEEFKKTGNCPQANYVACDGKIRKYCDNDPDSDTFDKIISEECEDACENGKCIEFSGNSCKNPYALKLNGLASGKTESGTNFSQMPVCSNLKSMMGVFKFTAPKLGFYKFTIASDSTENWGSILTTDCLPRSPIIYTCSFNGKSDEFTKLLSKSDYYLFVAPDNIFANHFEATVSVKEIDYNASPLCGNYSGNVQLIDFPKGKYSEDSSTSTGTSGVHWDETEGCGSTGNGGKDKAYIFSLSKKSTVKATLSLTSTSDLPNKIAVYINKCNNGSRHTVKTCGDGSSMAIATKELDPGEYILFVDSDGKDFSYNLQITVSE